MTAEHINFIKNEYGIDDINSLSDAEFDELYDKLCDREVDEVFENEKSDTCRIVADIVTYMGNQYKEYDSVEVGAKKDAKIAI